MHRVGWWPTARAQGGLAANGTCTGWVGGQRHVHRVGWWPTACAQGGLVANGTCTGWVGGQQHVHRVGWWPTACAQGGLVANGTCTGWLFEGTSSFQGASSSEHRQLLYEKCRLLLLVQCVRRPASAPPSCRRTTARCCRPRPAPPTPLCPHPTRRGPAKWCHACEAGRGGVCVFGEGGGPAGLCMVWGWRGRQNGVMRGREGRMALDCD